MTIQIWVIGKYKVDAIADTALVSSSSRVCIGFSNKITPLPTLKAMWGHAGTGIFAHSLGLWINSVPTVDFDEVVKRMPQALLTINTLIGTSLDRDEGAYVDESGVMAGWSEKSKAMVGYKYLIKGDDIKFE